MSKYGFGNYGSGAYDPAGSKYALMREAIGLALTDGAGIVGYPRQPAAPQPGDAWPQLAGLDPSGVPGVFAARWTIYLVCGGDLADAERFLDGHIEVVPDRLASLLWVESISPILISTPSGDLAAIQFDTVREG